MLFRFAVDVSDIDRGFYQTLDFRVAQHPSETAPYLLSRVLAYVLSFEEGLEFSAGGLGDPDAPALKKISGHGNIDLWIEIGNPSSRKLHKATKTAKHVRIFTYKNPEVLVQQLIEDQVHRASEIAIQAFAPQFLTDLESKLEKNNTWSALIQQGRLDVTIGTSSFSTELKT